MSSRPISPRSISHTLSRHYQSAYPVAASQPAAPLVVPISSPAPDYFVSLSPVSSARSGSPLSRQASADSDNLPFSISPLTAATALNRVSMSDTERGERADPYTSYTDPLSPPLSPVAPLTAPTLPDPKFCRAEGVLKELRALCFGEDHMRVHILLDTYILAKRAKYENQPLKLEVKLQKVESRAPTQFAEAFIAARRRHGLRRSDRFQLPLRPIPDRRRSSNSSVASAILGQPQGTSPPTTYRAISEDEDDLPVYSP